MTGKCLRKESQSHHVARAYKPGRYYGNCQPQHVLPSKAECCQAHLEAAIAAANQHHTAVIANRRPTTATKQVIDCLETQLEAVLNNI